MQLSDCANLFSIFSQNVRNSVGIVRLLGRPKIGANVFALGEVAVLEALTFILALMFI